MRLTIFPFIFLGYLSASANIGTEARFVKGKAVEMNLLGETDTFCGSWNWPLQGPGYHIA